MHYLAFLFLFIVSSDLFASPCGASRVSLDIHAKPTLVPCPVDGGPGGLGSHEIVDHNAELDSIARLRKIKAKGFRCTTLVKCMSETSIGHSCEDYTMAFTADEARVRFMNSDCCPFTKDKGRKVEGTTPLCGF